MSDEDLPKRKKRRMTETKAMERILERQVRRVSENPAASIERRLAADEIRRITDSITGKRPDATADSDSEDDAADGD